jgi:ATP-dependent exoDNAse (exonuclease V) alpha subunit
VAIYRLSAAVLKRSAGRSATASAAYRAAERIADERTGLAFDYRRKRGVVHTEIITPAGTPDWMNNRAQLWNAVEAAEKRKDSQLAREIILALPYELTHAQRVDLVRDFARAEFVGQGMIADIAIHAPHRAGDNRNHHAHLLLTMRELIPIGAGASGFGKKVRDWNDTERLEGWRAHWADTVNRHLEHAGHAARVDHRSLEDRGIDREPEPKQGPIATEMERAGRPSHAGDDRRAAQARNVERAQIADELAAISAAIIDLQAERDRRAGSEIDARIQGTMKEICFMVPRDSDRHLSR